MSKPKRRRRWTADQKLEIVLETLQSDRKLAEICRRVDRGGPFTLYARGSDTSSAA